MNPFFSLEEGGSLPEGGKPMERILLRKGSPARSRGEVPVALERRITLSIQGVGDFAVMALPRDLSFLAAGFAFTEGMISSREEIALIQACPEDPDIVRVLLEDPSHAGKTGRNLVITASCGICGGEKAVEEILREIPAVGDSLRVDQEWLWKAEENLFSSQELYPSTRGTHAAGIFTQEGEMLAFAEDIGRHNALDKVIGMCLLGGRETRGRALVLSSRLSFELVVKCARAGLELVAAASAPSTLAVEAAGHWGVTLCAPLREDQAFLFTHPHRVLPRSRAPSGPR